MGTKLGLATVVATVAVMTGIAWAGIPVKCPIDGGECTGTNGPDEIIGSDNPDQLNGLRGQDFLDGNEARDVLRAGPGNDNTAGDAGNDRHLGGPGSDLMSEFGEPSQGGADVMKGGSGNDFAEGNQQGDTLLGGKGNDRRRQEAIMTRQRRGGSESCFRGFCSNLFGDGGNDTVNGGEGKDYLEGEQGRDRHFGGPGADVIDSANDDTPGVKDKVSCGPGRDIVFANARDKVADDCEVERPPLPVEPRGGR